MFRRHQKRILGQAANLLPIMVEYGDYGLSIRERIHSADLTNSLAEWLVIRLSSTLTQIVDY